MNEKIPFIISYLSITFCSKLNLLISSFSNIASLFKFSSTITLFDREINLSTIL